MNNAPRCEDAPCCGCCGDLRESEDMREQYEAEMAEAEMQDEDGEGEDEKDGGEMDGDFDSAMASAGHGTDEDYGYYGSGEDY